MKIPAAMGLDGVIMLHKMFCKVVQNALRQSKNCIHAYTHEHVRIHIIQKSPLKFIPQQCFSLHTYMVIIFHCACTVC